VGDLQRGLRTQETVASKELVLLLFNEYRCTLHRRKSFEHRERHGLSVFGMRMLLR
jgi:hypothetical protein